VFKKINACSWMLALVCVVLKALGALKCSWLVACIPAMAAAAIDVVWAGAAVWLVLWFLSKID
jgi:hypothetical protein